MAFPFAPVGFALIAIGAWKDWNAKSRRDGNPMIGTDGLGRQRYLPSRGLGYAQSMPNDAQDLRFQNGHDGPKRVQKSQKYAVKSIQERAKYIKKALLDSSEDPDVITAARLIVSQKCQTLDGGKRWCIVPKDSLGEVRALFQAVIDPNSPFAMRYANDHRFTDQFSSANLSMRIGAGDCDDFVIYLGAMLTTLGFPVTMRIVQDDGSASWSHIYLLCDVAKGGNKWIALDPTEPQNPMGWQLDGADQVAKTGRPSGRTVAVLDVPVE